MRPLGKRYKIAIGKVKSGPYFWDENHKSLIFVPKITAPPKFGPLFLGQAKHRALIFGTKKEALISGTPPIGPLYLGHPVLISINFY